ncbi:helix-turn-helix transcriptional regulator [Virgibacillus senegalensis]|uniref:helix-turn-helix transcriptional regulator n=1 Tax=Virgibacillus senegalensis TaxID=1499679 RepID=UPI00069F9CBC|nr:AraC family transcriptional regulator [Virgibacillus senegalensis]
MSDTLTNILQHTYWREKQAFQLSEDVYEEWVAFAIEDGTIFYKMEEEEGGATYGDVILCPPGTVFKREVVTPVSFHFLRFECNDKWLETSLSVGKYTIKDRQRLDSTYTHFRYAALEDNPIHNNWKSHLLTDIWMLYFMEKNTDTDHMVHSKKNSLIADAKNYIDQHAFHKNLQVKQVAQEYGWSPVQFTRRFHAYQGITPGGYITNLRIQQAKKLLLETNDTVEHIAEQCGYNNGFYFSRRFSERVGVSPSKFREMNEV